VLNVFRMFSKMKGKKIEAESDGEVSLDDIVRAGVREKPDVAALAAIDQNEISILVWHYHDDDMAGPEASIRLNLKGIPAGKRNLEIREYRIDQEHGNAFTAWNRMGSPQQPTVEQYAELEKAGQLTLMYNPKALPIREGSAQLSFSLPRQAVSLFLLNWAETTGKP
jgi:xylan 1,4-beta-xylosidase